LHTGDLATMDARGYCRIEGRLKDMIIRGGENIYPREIEELLYTHPGVTDVAIVGVPDARWGEQVIAFVRAKDPAPSAEELEAFVTERLARYKTPKQWIFVETFPLTASGKVQKFKLRDDYVAEALAPAEPSSAVQAPMAAATATPPVAAAANDAPAPTKAASANRPESEANGKQDKKGKNKRAKKGAAQGEPVGAVVGGAAGAGEKSSRRGRRWPWFWRRK
jgi:hypothetical protein